MSKRARSKAKKRATPGSALEFREAIAYMHGVADAVSVRAAPLADAVESGASARSPSRRPTLRYGEVSSQLPEAPPERRRTVPYGSPGGPTERASQDYSAAPPEIAWDYDVLERPSGIRLRCAPLQEEWYELAGAERRK